MFTKGTICELKNRVSWMYAHLRTTSVVLFDEETTMNYLKSKGNNPRGRYLLVCRLEKYEEFQHFKSIVEVPDRYKSSVYLVETEAIIPVSNSHVSNALERLD